MSLTIEETVTSKDETMVFEFAPATRDEGLDRLADFIPLAGRQYAAQRNYDLGPDNRSNVSVLSPFIRHRLITEREVVERVLSHHSYQAAEKFIQEVLWRTYWKGWLELRPTVWRWYISDLAALAQQLDSDPERREAVKRAESGNTGIACFDTWANELRATGYLHNHARMWFASIWIFTLELPWQLGADFFMRHLLDGDPASNTLSWRWVAGLQTKGKTYLARADNIARYTDGRFNPRGELSPTATALSEDVDLPKPISLDPVAQSATEGHCALLLTEDDLAPDETRFGACRIAAAAVVSTVAGRSPNPISPGVRSFVGKAIGDAASRLESRFGAPTKILDGDSAVQCALAWAEEIGSMPIVMFKPPVGPGADFSDRLQSELRQRERELVLMRSAWDEEFWPHATRGFFPFKEKIPSGLAALGLYGIGRR